MYYMYMDRSIHRSIHVSYTHTQTHSYINVHIFIDRNERGGQAGCRGKMGGSAWSRVLSRTPCPSHVRPRLRSEHASSLVSGFLSLTPRLQWQHCAFSPGSASSSSSPSLRR